MPAFVVAEIEVTDPEEYAEYVKAVPATIEAFGGRYRVRNGRHEVLEGEEPRGRIVILEFPDYERAQAWWRSAGYVPLKRIRRGASRARIFLIDGYEE